MRFEQYCIHDREFFTKSAPQSYSESVSLAVELPEYFVDSDGYWTHLIPKAGFEVDIQGWKIHLSSALGTEQEVVREAARICGELALPFKHVSSLAMYRMANSKNAARTSAGKLVTIYPPPELLQQTLDRLEEALERFPGPNILTDVRWKNGPVFVRYGAFKEVKHGDTYCIRRPDGTLEEDIREPWFTCPEWVDVPEFLRPAIERRLVHDVPFAIKSAKKHSNAGGIYLAECLQTGREILIKEGRRYAGYTIDGADGYDRVSGEARVLRELGGAGASPLLLWEGDLSDHYFMAASKHAGITLQLWMASNIPVYDDSCQAWERYAASCAHIVGRLVEAVSALSAAGFVHGDIHPQNILIDPDTMKIGLVDFETAMPLSGSMTRGINAPGYTAPTEISPRDLDRFAIVTIVTDLLTGRVEHEDITVSRYNWTVPALLERLKLNGGSVPTPVLRLVSLQQEMLRAMEQYGGNTNQPPPSDFLLRIKKDLPKITATARKRFGHLPVHYEAFEDDLSGLGLGFAGQVMAYPDCADEEVVIRSLIEEASKTHRTGLFDGLCGSVYALLTVGAAKEAGALLRDGDIVGRTKSLRMFDGLAGIFLTALKIESYPKLVKHISDNIENNISAIAHRYLASRRPFKAKLGVRTNRFVQQSSGLMYGDLGLGWLFAEAYKRYGNNLYMDALNRALLAELDNYEVDPRGGLQYRDDGRLLPYLATGSAGFGVVLHDLDSRMIDPAIVTVVDDLIRASSPSMSTGCGLFNGYAGLFYGANGLRKFAGKDCKPLSDLEGTVRGFAVPTSFGMWAVPGDENIRITTDLATGVSGIVHATNMVAQGHYGMLRTL
ncbi:class III lanthionine synthetase LanKC N-terminal domain-containing protein [Nocardia asiatica]|uniref:class III lanthionine synthetase LanKC N-terminal domain-containing protein n=1 Tax=Nocardia asiatica TaxID=209252 RepID=UPI0012FCCD55|nr:phosphotransferase [Nocardia asiatica]